jgi:hypothetical protein
MTVGTTPDTFHETPYLTLSEYKNAPTSIDYNNLVIGGNANAQDAELEKVILRASSYMDEYFNANLNATKYTETQRTRFTPDGFIALHPNNTPIIALENFNYGTNPNNLITLSDPSLSWFEEQQIIIPLSNIATAYSSQGPLAFGGYGLPRQQVYCKYTYVAGYVNNPIASATAGATSLTVQRSEGILPNQKLRIYDGASSESVTVASNYTYGSTTVPVTSPLTYSHTTGSSIGNLPNVLKEACILITTAFIKVRGDSSMTMNITTFPQANPTPGANRYGSEIALALDMVNKYRRIR